MHPKSLLAALPFALAVLGAPSSATAADIVLSPTGSGSLAGSFTQAANGLVIDDFSFLPTSFDGTVSVTLTSLSGPVSFFTAAFFPDTANEIDFQNLGTGAGGSFSFAAPVDSTQPLTLRVFGAVTDPSGNLGGDGSYNVAVIAAVPEPQTVALLLAGLFGVGVAVRRRAD